MLHCFANMGDEGLGSTC